MPDHFMGIRWCFQNFSALVSLVKFFPVQLSLRKDLRSHQQAGYRCNEAVGVGVSGMPASESQVEGHGAAQGRREGLECDVLRAPVGVGG